MTERNLITLVDVTRITFGDDYSIADVELLIEPPSRQSPVRCTLHGTVGVSNEPSGYPEPHIKTQAYKQLLEHLEAFAEELREMLKH